MKFPELLNHSTIFNQLQSKWIWTGALLPVWHNLSWGPCSFKVSGSAQLEKNKIGAGDVTAVFWACLIPAINLQMRIPPISKIIVLAKGAIAALAAFLGVTADSKHPDSKHPVPFFIQVCTRKSRPLRKIKHSKCCGKLALKKSLVCLPFSDRPCPF